MNHKEYSSLALNRKNNNSIINELDDDESGKKGQ